MKWRAIVLAAGRGPSDPMAAAYGVSHKCLVEIGGVPMLRRVVETLADHPSIGDIWIAIDNRDVGVQALGDAASKVTFVPTAESAARTVSSLLAQSGTGYPILLTTADHPLLTAAMIDSFLAGSTAGAADLTVGLASAETILAAYPDARRTFLRFGEDRVSGCNLFGLRTANAVKAIDFWHYLEPLRKKPWRLFAAFGPMALLRFFSGKLNLERAFAVASRRIGLVARPILLPFADAAVDVDKPADKELAELILKKRAAHQ
ncbi:MAG: NTP transferase domain-containing protein [Hyphomicrobiales bacterium]